MSKSSMVENYAKTILDLADEMEEEFQKSINNPDSLWSLNMLIKYSDFEKIENVQQSMKGTEKYKINKEIERQKYNY